VQLPLSASAPPIVKLALLPTAAAVEIPSASKACVSAVIKTALTSDPAINYSLISPRRTIALYSALPTGGKVDAFLVVFLAAGFLAGAFFSVDFLVVAIYNPYRPCAANK
jgi:hypothetical protein